MALWCGRVYDVQMCSVDTSVCLWVSHTVWCIVPLCDLFLLWCQEK